MVKCYLPSNVQELRVQTSSSSRIPEEVGALVWSRARTSVPVVGNSLSNELEVTIRSLDTEPGFEDIMGENADWFFLSMVRHESEDESICGRLDEHSSEWTVEEEFVVGNLGVESIRPVLRKCVESDDSARGDVEKLLKLIELHSPVVTLAIKVSSCW